MNLPGKTPMHGRFDHLAHWLVLAGGIIHGAGANMLKARNEELAAELHNAAKTGAAAVRHAYELGRIHQAAGAPGLGADDLAETVAGMVAEAPDADEHQGAEAVGSSTSDASRSTGETLPVDKAPGDASVPAAATVSQ